MFNSLIQTTIACLIVWLAMGVMSISGCFLEKATAQSIIQGE
jgi:hypothetical protein